MVDTSGPTSAEIPVDTAWSANPAAVSVAPTATNAAPTPSACWTNALFSDTYLATCPAISATLDARPDSAGATAAPTVTVMALNAVTLAGVFNGGQRVRQREKLILGRQLLKCANVDA